MYNLLRVLTTPCLLALCGAIIGLSFVALCVGLVLLGPWGFVVACAAGAGLGAVGALLIGRIYRYSITDAGTGLHNRRMLFARLERAFTTATRRKQSLAFLMIEVDAMRTYNNRYGHVFGDQVIRAVGRTIAHTVGKRGLVGRWGGDEFGVVLADTSSAQARVLSDHIATQIGRIALPAGPILICDMQVSIGIAEYAPSMGHYYELMQAADADMYRVKAGKSASSASYDYAANPLPHPDLLSEPVL